MSPAASNPHLILSVGTQVVALVEVRGTDGRAVHPRGAVGVVVQSPSDYWHSYRVRFPDGFEAAFKRAELAILSEYKLGDIATGGGPLAEYDLYEHVIYRCVVGSRAYGLEGETSDTDRRGVYLPPAERHWSLYGVPEQLENHDTQETYWEIQKFLTMALKANPNVLECLYTPLVEHASPLAREMVDQRQRFLSRMVYQTYNGYVLSQFKKLQADLRNQGAVKWKHVMHLIRLLISGVTVLREGHVPVRVDQHRDKLLAIKRGEIPWEQVDAWRLDLHRDFDAAAEATELPERPDCEWANELLVRARLSMVPVPVASDPEVPAAAAAPLAPLAYWSPEAASAAPQSRAAPRTLPPQWLKIAYRVREYFEVWLLYEDWERSWFSRYPHDVSVADLHRLIRSKLHAQPAEQREAQRMRCVACGHELRGPAAEGACPGCGGQVMDGGLRQILAEELGVRADAIGSHSLVVRNLGMITPRGWSQADETT